MERDENKRKRSISKKEKRKKKPKPKPSNIPKQPVIAPKTNAESGEDKIVKEMKVFFCPNPEVKVSFLQYPLRQPDHPIATETWDFDVHRKAEEAEEFGHRLHTCRPRGEEFRFTYTLPRSLGSGQTVLKSKPVLAKSNHLAAFVKDGNVYLIPVDNIQHIVPDCSEMSQRKPDPDEEEVKPVWKPLRNIPDNQYHGQKRFRSVANDLPLSTSDGRTFLDRFLPPPPVSRMSHSLSRKQLLLLPQIIEKVSKIMQQAKILNFTTIVRHAGINIHHGPTKKKLLEALCEVAFLICGVWIVKSELLLPKEQGTLRYQRNCMLEILHKHQFIDPELFSNLAKADFELMENLLTSICKKRVERLEGKTISTAWDVKVEDDFFATKHPEIVEHNRKALERLVFDQERMRKSWNRK